MIRHVKKIFELEAATGVLLLLTTVAALLVANFSEFRVNENLHHAVNDGLMVLFFCWLDWS